MKGYEVSVSQAHELIGGILNCLAGDVTECTIQVQGAKIVLMGRSHTQESILIGMQATEGVIHDSSIDIDKGVSDI